VVRLHTLAATLGLGVGMVAVAFLGAVHLVTRALWSDSAPAQWLPGPDWAGILLVCGSGGVLVGLLNRGGAVHDLQSTLEEADHDPPTGARGSVDLGRVAVLGVVSLGFGGALGPEAPLIAIVAGLVMRVRSVLRLAREEAAEIRQPQLTKAPDVSPTHRLTIRKVPLERANARAGPSWGNTPYRPRFSAGAYSAASSVAPAHSPPTASPWQAALMNPSPGIGAQRPTAALDVNSTS
jgi:hypothetical protein